MLAIRYQILMNHTFLYSEFNTFAIADFGTLLFSGYTLLIDDALPIGAEYQQFFIYLGLQLLQLILLEF